MFLAFPLLALPVLLYNLVVLTLTGGAQASEAADQLARPLLVAPMPSGGGLTVSLGDILLVVSLVVLFVELMKATDSRRIAILNHLLSMGVLVLCVAELLLLKGFATSVFLLISMMVLLDVLAGFVSTVTLSRGERGRR